MSLVETLHRRHLERQLRITQAALAYEQRKVKPVVIVTRAPRPAPEPKPKPIPEPIPEPLPAIDDPSTPLRMETIRKAVAQHYGIRRHDLLSDRRTANIVLPRQVAFYIGRRLTTLSLPMIGRHMGRRDHTTVLHGVRTIARKMETDEQLRASVEMLIEQLGGDPG